MVTAKGHELTWKRDLTTAADVRVRTLETSALVSISEVPKAKGAPSTFVNATNMIHEVDFAGTPLAGLSLEQVLSRFDPDGLLILHQGRIAYERYFNGFEPHQRHLLASQTKSIVGLLFGILENKDFISRNRLLSYYVPEFRGTAFGDAEVQHALHMQVPLRYGGRPYNQLSDSIRLSSIVGYYPLPEGYVGPRSIHDWLLTSQAAGTPGKEFRYDNGTCESVSWAIERASGTQIAQLLGETLWSKLGAEENSGLVTDAEGTAMTSGGMVTTLRDLARIGEMLRCGGFYNGTQIVPERVVNALTANVPAELQAQIKCSDAGENASGYGYHDLWWIPDPKGRIIQAHGKHFQRLIVHPDSECVFALFSSSPGQGRQFNTVMSDIVSAVIKML